jgi:hypothetical protein
MPDSQFMTALEIIRAQASTELVPIQQHRMVYEQLDSGSLNGLGQEVVEGIEVSLPERLTLERELQNRLFVMATRKRTPRPSSRSAIRGSRGCEELTPRE